MYIICALLGFYLLLLKHSLIFYEIDKRTNKIYFCDGNLKCVFKIHFLREQF